jgi:hypothetical protein
MDEPDDVLYWTEYTANVEVIWQEVGIHLPHLSGLSTDAAAPRLSAGISLIREHQESLRQYEPSNKWGSFDGALRFLEDIFASCIAHPGMTLTVSL